MFKKKRDPVIPLLLGLAAVILVIAAGLLLNTYVFGVDEPLAVNDQLVITMDATVRANITNVPLATPLSSDDAAEFTDFESRIIACEDYSAERRSQMLQHIEWLVDPSGIPVDIISAFGTNVQGRLIFGMANYTSIQWRLLERPAESCLVEIGQDLDLLMTAFDQIPLGIYEEVAP